MSPEGYDLDRYWSKVSNPPHAECWTWVGTLHVDGYGTFELGGKNLRAHRVAYELEFGPIPAGKFVCHLCDNPRCVNPYHLFLGTHADNMADMSAKGRRSGRAPRLTEEQKREIVLAAEWAPQSQIARRMGLSRNTVMRVLHDHRRRVAPAITCRPS